MKLQTIFFFALSALGNKCDPGVDGTNVLAVQGTYNNGFSTVRGYWFKESTKDGINWLSTEHSDVLYPWYKTTWGSPAYDGSRNILGPEIARDQWSVYTGGNFPFHINLWTERIYDKDGHAVVTIEHCW
jgi:hypothetical protein